MGYTHYLRQHQEIPVEAWAKIKADAERLIEAARLGDVEICGWDGTGEPVVDGDEIRLNGSGRLDLDHETFALERTGNGFSFCKTARKPYDPVVAGILARAVHHAGPAVLEVSSDGDVHDWADVIRLLERLWPDDDMDVLVAQLVGDYSRA
jgi:hypothetical protein